MHQSIATISSPEFINLQPLDINPLMSSCEIKVLYVGENRNRSMITKDVASEMAKTLRGAPIVGYFKDEDFTDHGEQIIYEEGELHFNCLTVPYGFVSPDAKVWFQKFNDTNEETGEVVEREYLMTTGYLWTGQYEEAKTALEGAGRPHSMELDKDTLSGEWSHNFNKDLDFFIVSDAIFSKLCVLGEETEPCFEGSTITRPNISARFSKKESSFKQTLFTMMQDLKTALEGGTPTMNNLNEEKVVDTAVEETVETPVAETEFEAVEGEGLSNFKKEDEEDKKAEAPAKKEEDGEKKEESKDSDKEEKDSDEKPAAPAEKKEEEDDKKKKKGNFELEEELANTKAALEELQSSYSALEEKYNALVEFKASIDNQKKDELIAEFYMLSDEDKKDVIENKTKYSLEQIEEKLSVICFRKKVNFDLDNESKNENVVENESVVTTFTLDEVEESVPAWIQAVRDVQNLND